jgi:predicted nucleotidyltransferase
VSLQRTWERQKGDLGEVGMIPLTFYPYLPDKEIVSITEVGSGMWGMRDLSSDYDLVVVYSENMIDFLSGREYKANLPSKHHVMIDGKEYDFQYMEIGHLINLLKKGNINTIWAVLSPIVISTSEIHAQLKEYIRRYPTRAIMPSLEGMTISQIYDAEKRALVRSPEKSLLTARRTVRFGENLYWKGEYIFEPITGNHTTVEICAALDVLKTNMKNALFPEIPAHGLEQILFDYRYENLVT